MPTIEDSSFDLVIACDVLEHVHKDKLALKEIHRILKPNGYAILTVPQKDHLKTTFEDLTITNPQEREKIFGQYDHLRIYGNNFSETVEKANFKVSTLNENDLPKAVKKLHVLFPPILSTNPLATNYRKIFVAQKKQTIL